MARTQKCSCGGDIKAVTIKSLDLEPLFGLRGVFEGPVPGYRCEACAAETFDGGVYDRVQKALARSVLARPRILTPDEARFLRKAVLGLTQSNLAERMGINSVTVADWERGERPLSKEHDYALRGIALSALAAPKGAIARHHFHSLLQAVLGRPRLQAPPRRAHRYLVSGW
jgi:DNA-binding transcriptional regulator YiaG